MTFILAAIMMLNTVAPNMAFANNSYEWARNIKADINQGLNELRYYLHSNMESTVEIENTTAELSNYIIDCITYLQKYCPRSKWEPILFGGDLEYPKGSLEDQVVQDIIKNAFAQYVRGESLVITNSKYNPFMNPEIITQVAAEKPTVIGELLAEKIMFPKKISDRVLYNQGRYSTHFDPKLTPVERANIARSLLNLKDKAFEDAVAASKIRRLFPAGTKTEVAALVRSYFEYLPIRDNLNTKRGPKPLRYAYNYRDPDGIDLFTQRRGDYSTEKAKWEAKGKKIDEEVKNFAETKAKTAQGIEANAQFAKNIDAAIENQSLRPEARVYLKELRGGLISIGVMVGFIGIEALINKAFAKEPDMAKEIINNFAADLRQNCRDVHEALKETYKIPMLKDSQIEELASRQDINRNAVYAAELKLYSFLKSRGQRRHARKRAV